MLGWLVGWLWLLLSEQRPQEEEEKKPKDDGDQWGFHKITCRTNEEIVVFTHHQLAHSIQVRPCNPKMDNKRIEWANNADN